MPSSAHPDGPILDLHVITIDAYGDGAYGPAEGGDAFPAASLTGRGRISGRNVDCISPEWLVAFHDQYAGDAQDRTDVRAVCAAYGLAVPAQYR